MEARFWVIHQGSPVRVKLRAGQSVSAYEGGRTEEGYCDRGTRWTFDGEVVWREWYTDARDCDGRVETSGADHCRVDRLGDHVSGWEEDEREGRTWPHWDEEVYHQRDHSAEAAGY